MLTLDTYAGLREFAFAGGKAVMWGIAPIKWTSRPFRGGINTLRAFVNNTEVLRKELTYEEAVGLDTVIGFQFKDALGCEYGFGAVFAKVKPG